MSKFSDGGDQDLRTDAVLLPDGTRPNTVGFTLSGLAPIQLTDFQAVQQLLRNLEADYDRLNQRYGNRFASESILIGHLKYLCHRIETEGPGIVPWS